MFKEFKEFALKGNAIELAIGVIIGGAFQSIIKSLVNDIIMPTLSLLIGNVNFSDWFWKIGNTTIPYGSFLSAVINFLLLAFSLFLIVRYFNKLNTKLEKAKLEEAKKFEKFKNKSKFLQNFNKKSKKENITPEIKSTTKLCPYCLSEINIKATRCPHCTSNIE